MVESYKTGPAGKTASTGNPPVKTGRPAKETAAGLNRQTEGKDQVEKGPEL